MSVRQTKFVMVPMWVIEHPSVRATPAVMLSYVALRVLAWRHPDREWPSDRALAEDMAAVAGLSASGARKHLAWLRSFGIVEGSNGAVTLLDTDPGFGPHQGHGGPHQGQIGPHQGQIGPHQGHDTASDLVVCETPFKEESREKRKNLLSSSARNCDAGDGTLRLLSGGFGTILGGGAK